MLSDFDEMEFQRDGDGVRAGDALGYIASGATSLPDVLSHCTEQFGMMGTDARLAVASLQARGYLVVYGDKIALTIRGLVRAHREWRQPTIPDSEHPLRLRAIAAELHARAIAPGNDGGGPGEWRIDTEAGMLLEVADELERLREELSR